MKVLALGTECRVIIEAHQNEVANLLGQASTIYMRPIVAGMEIQVSDMFRQLDSLRAREKQLSRTAKELRLIADLLEVQEAVIYPEQEAPDGQ